MVASQQTFFVLRKNVFGKCIDMYPLQEWENMIAGVRARLNLFDPKHAAFFREFCRGTQEVEMDTNGRILLPRKMLDEIGIDKEMVLAAQDSMIQVWDARVYEEVAISGEELGMMAKEIFKKLIYDRYVRISCTGFAERVCRWMDYPAGRCVSGSDLRGGRSIPGRY